MKKPTHPASQGKKPEEKFSKSGRLHLADLDDGDRQVSLKAVIGAWNKAVKDHESQGHRIVEGPAFDSSVYYGSSLSLAYKYEWDNLNYPAEQAAWDAALAAYETGLVAWNAFEEERKKGLAASPKNIDQQIERTEHRLANLKAHKAGEPIPFPEG
jgi:hypothetical protein